MTTAAPTAHEGMVHGAGRTHPSDRNYMGIALILGLITAGEIGLYYIDIGSAMIPMLLVMMVAKFAIVALWFMHLHFDSRLFRRLFVGGLILAVFVYMVFLTAMQLFGTNTTAVRQSLAAVTATV